MAKDFSVEEWLSDVVGLPQYIDTFLSSGFTELCYVVEIDEIEYCEELGIKSKEHQIKIIQECAKLKKKHGPRKILLLGPKSSGKSTILQHVGNKVKWKGAKWRLRVKCVECILTLCEMPRFYDNDYDELKNKNYLFIK